MYWGYKQAEMWVRHIVFVTFNFLLPIHDKRRQKAPSTKTVLGNSSGQSEPFQGENVPISAPKRHWVSMSAVFSEEKFGHIYSEVVVETRHEASEYLRLNFPSLKRPGLCDSRIIVLCIHHVPGGQSYLQLSTTNPNTFL